jgi:hypothetical protein
VQGKPTAGVVQVRFGDPLLTAAAGLLAALGDREEFPQDRAGIDALIAGIAKGPDGEEVWATYEAPDDLPTYIGGHGTWVSPAGEGRLRLRLLAHGADRLASQVWILGPDGSLSDPDTIEGHGVPDAELPEKARAELEELERRRRRAVSQMPELERRNEEIQHRFRVDHLVGVVAGPAAHDQTGLVVSHVVLYDTGPIITYLLPRPDAEHLDPDDPWAVTKAAEDRELELDDELGTEFATSAGSVDPNGEGPLRCRREFTPAVPVEASRLLIKLGEERVEIKLGPA